MRAGLLISEFVKDLMFGGGPPQEIPPGEPINVYVHIITKSPPPPPPPQIGEDPVGLDLLGVAPPG